MVSGLHELQMKCCRNTIVDIWTREQRVCVLRDVGLDIWGCVGVWVLDVQYSLASRIYLSMLHVIYLLVDK